MRRLLVLAVSTTSATALAGLRDLLDAGKRTCDLDLMAEASTVVVARKGALLSGDVTLIARGLDRAKVTGCLAAIASAAPAVQQGPIAGAVAGLGAGEVARRVLDAEAVTAIIEREIQERTDAATTLAELGKHDEAATLQRQVDVLVALQ